MKKRLLAMFLAAVMTCALLPATASAADSDFVIEDGVLTKYRGRDEDVIIPDNVTKIGDEAFCDNTDITSVTIPDSVISIGQRVFSGCTYLKEILVSSDNNWFKAQDGVLLSKSGGTLVAYPAGKAGRYTIPDGVNSVAKFAFEGSSKLIEVTIPNSVTRIPYGSGGAFLGCTGLENIILQSGNTEYTVLDGVLFSKDMTELRVYPGGKTGAYTLPGSVTEIYAWAFFKCTGLSELTIPDGEDAVHISYYAFSDCAKLTSMNIPNREVRFEDYYDYPIFDGCDQLTIYGAAGSMAEQYCLTHNVQFVESVDGFVIEDGVLKKYTGPGGDVVIPDGVTEIGADAFKGCTTLIGVRIPDEVNYIGDRAFQGCTGLTSVTIPNGVRRIWSETFAGCTNLTSVTIPASVTGIADWAFSDCTSLASVTIPKSVTRIGGSAFENCASLTSVTIPNSVTYIGIMAFKGCSSLTSVTIPESVTTIESEAFRNCRGLTSLMIPGSVSEIHVDTFRGCTNLTDVIIGNGVTRIDNHVFLGCVNLVSVTIPASVHYIASSIFDAQTEGTLTVYGYLNTQAEFYCTGHRVRFVSLGIAPATAQAGTLESADGQSVSWAITEEGEITVDVETANLTPEEAILVGCFDSEHRFTGVKVLDADSPEAQIDPNTPNVKLFWLNGAQKPQSPSATVWGK